MDVAKTNLYDATRKYNTMGIKTHDQWCALYYLPWRRHDVKALCSLHHRPSVSGNHRSPMHETSSNGSIFCVTGHLCGEFTVPRWIPTKASDAENDVSLICVRINGWANNREAGDLRRHRAHYDFIVMFDVSRAVGMNKLLNRQSSCWWVVISLVWL